ncbi:MAG TPA: LacI family DNA-binding transcriptional regulator [Micromonosporaceae bacterium]|jgi:DNA-binding LacI/PurR family transcriptional regulator|nr:LacI family DNA-binding transcriptional regulator [Micromonosporaceae bacterium]
MVSQRQRSPGRPTLEEVAAAAGVGRGTVSRVVNGSPQVSPAAKEAVERAIADLGYVPNRAARALVTQRTDSVALVVSESEDRVFGQPFFAGIIRGISSSLAETPLQLWLAMAQSSAERVRLNLHLTRQHVDGVLLLSLHDDDPLPALLADRDLPVVLGGRTASMLGTPEAAPVSFVDVDNVGGARLATTHLVAANRRRIATIAGPQDMGAGVARLAGYRDAMAAESRTVDPRLIAYGDFTEDSGIVAMRHLLAARPDIDAVFAANDPMALGALRVLRDSGLRVPEDVAVVGFDDSVIASQTQPTLTSVHQPIEEMGRAMVRLLYDKIRGIQPDAPYIILGTHLVERDSG